MEETSKTSTEITTATAPHSKGIVSHQESFSQESSQSESHREVGNAKISEKSSNFQSEATAQVIQKTGTGKMSTVHDNEKGDGGGVSRIEVMERSTKNENVSGVDELIKSFEENQLTKSASVSKSEIEIPLRELNRSSSSKALELINKYIDVPEPEKETTGSSTTATTTWTPLSNKENVKPEKPEVETNKLNLLDVEMKQLTKDLEDLKKEEERCEKTYITRETSTSSLEESFVKRLQERQYKNIRDVINENLPQTLFNKIKRPESLPAGNLVHLLQSVQIAQELNSIIKQPNEVREDSHGTSYGLQGKMMNGSISRSNSFVNSIIRKFERQESSESPVPVRRKPGSQRGVPIQKSASASGIVESGRGFKPSDRYDLSKREFLTALSEKIWHVSSSEVSDFLSSDHLPVLNVTVVSPRVATWSFYCDIWNLTTVG
ncbi:hypothetical protein RUM44_004396 [Polyplax serrata]|uniref:Uncharacterized protein n=1 Tax=Polyplax serrata TaxID=468196 RepID=A0ABR1B2Q8_POLSC